MGAVGRLRRVTAAGRVRNPDQLRVRPGLLSLLTASSLPRPVAAICHSPWTLIEATYLKDGHRLTIAGLIWKMPARTWVIKVVVDDGLVTSRKPGIYQLNRAMIEEVCGGQAGETEVA